MPRYDYVCDANGKTIEVSHGMSRTVKTWGELCELADADPGQTPTSSPVRRAISQAVPLKGSGAMPSGGGGCGPGCGCHPH